MGFVSENQIVDQGDLPGRLHLFNQGVFSSADGVLANEELA